MGKNKQQKTTPAEQLKDKGNRAFLAGKFQEAVDFYSQAISLNN